MSLTFRSKELKNDGEIRSLSENDDAFCNMGYEETLHRGLDSFMNFAIGLSEVAALVSISITYSVGLIAGGPVLLIWGFVLAFFMSTIVSFSLAEICSAYPSAGSVYHWAGQLSPVEDAALWSYVCGWANFVGNFAGDASFAAGFGVFTSSAIAATGGEQLSNAYQVLLSIVILLIWTLLNFFRVDKVGWLNSFAAFLHIGTIIFVMAMLFSNADHLNTAESIFTHYNNETGFDSVIYVCLIATVTGMFAFIGYEASSHMAEETNSNATSSSSTGMIYTVLATGVLGLIYIFTLLAVTLDIQAITNGTEQVNTGNAVINIFVTICGNTWGSVLAWLLVSNIFFAGNSSVTVTGRITYALARDKTLPWWEILEIVDPYWQSPIMALLFAMVLGWFFNLLPLTDFGKNAFYSLVGLSTVGFQVSYAIPIYLKVLYDPLDFPLTSMTLGDYSYPFGIISCIWLFGSGTLFFLPVTYPVTLENMNWLILSCTIVCLIGTMNWVFNSRYTYTGPKRYDTHLTLLERERNLQTSSLLTSKDI